MQFFQPAAIFLFIHVVCAVRPEGDASGKMDKDTTGVRTAAVLQSGHLQKVATQPAADPPPPVLVVVGAGHGDVAPTVDVEAPPDAKLPSPASLIEEQAEEESEGRNHEDTFWCRNYCAMCPPLKPEAERELNVTNRGKRTYVYIHRSQHFLKKLVAPVHFVLNVATLGMMNKASHALFGKDSAHCPNTKLDWQVDGYGAVSFSAQLDYGLVFSKVNGPLEFLKFHAELWSKKMGSNQVEQVLSWLWRVWRAKR